MICQWLEINFSLSIFHFISMNKIFFLDKLQRERDKFERLLNRTGFANIMTVKGVSGNWSIKDIIAHIWAYEQYISDRLNEIKHGEIYHPCKTHNALDAFLEEFGYPDFGSPLLDDDTPNAWVYEKYKNVSLEEIVAQEVQAFNSIITTITSMPESVIEQNNLYERVADNTYHHYQEHVKAIRVWLKNYSDKTKKYNAN